MNDINKLKKPNTEVNEKLTKEELIKRYASIQDITYEAALEEIGASSEQEILKNIQERTLEKIKAKHAFMNRAQRRALKKKMGAKKYDEMFANNMIEAVNETAEKLNYIDLIEKLRELNKKREEEEKENEDVNEDN